MNVRTPSDENPADPVGVESSQECLPLVIGLAHPAEPICPVGDRNLAHGAGDPAVGCGKEYGVATAGATGSEYADVVDVVEG